MELAGSHEGAAATPGRREMSKKAAFARALALLSCACAHNQLVVHHTAKNKTGVLDASYFHVSDSEDESVIHQILFTIFRFVEIRVRDEFW